jgi:hypothetical protein
MQMLHSTPTLILDQLFMMKGISSGGKIIFKKNQMRVICQKNGCKVVPYAILLNSLFSPQREADVMTKDSIHELGSIAASTIITELLDQNKATFKYVSVSESEFSYR